MSLINYIEPANTGELFTGLGSLIVFCVAALIIYRAGIKIVQYLDVLYNREAKYTLLEESLLDNIAKAKNVDLNKELAKREMLWDQKKNFRKKLEEEIYDEMFGKEGK
jgi:hypothetical protein